MRPVRRTPDAWSAGRPQRPRPASGRQAPADQGGWRGALDPTGPHPQPAVGELHHLRGVVADVQDGDRQRGQPGAQVGRELRLRVRVQAGERLVQKQQLRPARQRPRHGHPLALSAREPRRACARGAGPCGVRATARSSSAWGRRARAPTVADVLLHREVREQRGVLEHHAHGAPVGLQEAALLLPRAAGDFDAAVEPLKAARARSNIDLPAPDGPVSAVTSPAAAVNSTSSEKAPRRPCRRARRPLIRRCGQSGGR